MTSLKKNIIANLVGNSWQAIMGLIFIPLYIRFMGIESYGLVGIFATLQVMFGLLDVGLSSTLTREIARLSVLPSKEQEMRNLVRTLETLYWTVAVFVGIIVVSSSPFIAHQWIKAGQLPPTTIKQSLFIMGFVMVFQMPIGFYSGGLIGLQKQILLNTINASMATLRGAGAVLLLWLVSPTIQTFFLWQIVISVINCFLVAFFLWRELPSNEKRAVFQKQLLGNIWWFTAGISGITILGVILSQLDKIILSKILSLELFGYYTLASVVAMSLGRISIPVFFGVYPRFIQLFSLDNQTELKRLYHQTCQFMSILVLPVAVIVALFSYEILLLWTHDPVMAEKSHFLVTILVCGTALNCLMCIPYALQLAFGWTNLSLFKNIISVIIVVPLMIYMTKKYGATGGAGVWLILNMCDFFLVIPLMHQRLLRKEQWRWYWQDVGLPLAVGLIIAGLGRAFIVGPMSSAWTLTYLLIVSLSTLAMTTIAMPTTRKWLLRIGLNLI
jgi:O-antigen/teichoic acid export membrane protein